MNVTFFGTGYVGLVTGACFAELGHNVICMDINAEKIEGLKNGKIPIYEEGLEELVRKNVKAGRLTFTTDYKEAIANSLILFIAVGTPMADDGTADLSYVFKVAESIGELVHGYKVIVDKSTVPVGTAKRVSEIIGARYKGEFDVVSNPEFLREGTAIEDFMNPDRVVLGVSSEKAYELMRDLYKGLQTEVQKTNPETAEMIKYASNSFLATSISFINELTELCETVGADVVAVAEGMKTDRRIGKKAFLNAGPGYGGSCFPKDVSALVKVGNEHGSDLSLLRQVIEVNEKQHHRIAEKVLKLVPDLKGKKIAVWGIAFKAGTDDVRKSPALCILNKLLNRGAEGIVAYDPVAFENAKKEIPGLAMASSPQAAAEGADCLLVLTEWPEFKDLNIVDIIGKMREPNVVDARNIYNAGIFKGAKVNYLSVGRKELWQAKF